MSDRESFVAAIAANPADDLPRLVFADWLDEHGDPERAEFIRTQIRWHHADGEEKQLLRSRAHDLLREHWERWFGPFILALDSADHTGRRYRYAGALNPPHVFPTSTAREDAPLTRLDFARGFVSNIDLDLNRWRAGASLVEAFGHEPVTVLNCSDGLHSPRWVPFTEPCLRRVQRLSVRQVWAWGVSAPESTALLEDPHLAGVREFTLDPVVNDAGDRHPLPAPWVTRFVRSSLAYRLAGLTLRHLGDDAVPALCKPGRLQLERLELGGELNADNVRRLGESELVGGVCELRLIRASLGNTEVAALARDPWRKLTVLNLSHNRSTATVLPALAAAEFLPRLKVLNLSHNPLFDGTDLSGLQRLAEALDPERLERLDLTDTGLSHVPDFLAERFGDRVVV
jgi:uncharacterized protein (TIGR02996 family)